MTKILLLGDSLVADYDWQSRMPAYQVINLGVPGAMAVDLLASLPDIKQDEEHADVIMIMIGTNDVLAGNYEYIIILKKILVQLSHDFPSAEIIVNNLFPMKLPYITAYTIDNLNSHVEAFTMQTGCCFLDTHRRLSESEKPVFQADGVHITAAGYEIWARAILEHIAFLVEND